MRWLNLHIYVSLFWQYGRKNTNFFTLWSNVYLGGSGYLSAANSEFGSPSPDGFVERQRPLTGILLSAVGQSSS